MSYICPKCKKEYSHQEFSGNKFCTDCGSCLTAASSRARQGHWLFQANPSKLRILDWWKDHPDAEAMAWSVRQHQKSIRKGDNVVIWVSGPRGGVYATAEADSNPSRSVKEDPGIRDYYTDRIETLKINPRIWIRYTNRLFTEPIRREECEKDPVLSGLRILRQSQGTNFPITATQWNRIIEIIGSREGKR
ncbi:hypothetical protein A3K69_06905 [Candidatus Bathyarchaeota archaeon RBG_16_57_9]|jgi:hypothetical protein|nr:MAG: hypothetical protein A3K69_06905 [Candidatus Bathyarchaeota archaeon RBG_16_57_9]OGD54452.1 MAG: hypothetical protein A3K81_06255 [Candidatus Bathyarchaeota archaeon RBG_13_60_20]